MFKEHDIELQETKAELADYSYSNFVKNSPVAELRSGQKMALSEISKAFVDPKIKYVILDAPTGSGKSILSTALASAMHEHGAYILTSNIMLQNQYIKDFGHKMKEMKGRSNYSCLDKKEARLGTDCAKATCRKSKDGRKSCRDNWSCGYHKAFDSASSSNVTLMNFASALAQINYNQSSLKKFLRRELMVVDEAHLIEPQLTGFLEFSLTLKDALQATEEELPDEGAPSSEYIGMLRHTLINLQASLEAQDSPSYEKDLDLYSRCKKIIEELERDPSNIVVQKSVIVNDEPKFTFRPIDVSPYAKDCLFNFCNKVVLMSATIVNYKAYIQSLGISEDESVYIEIPSTFPVENRPIYKSYVGKMNYQNMQQVLPVLTERVNQFMNHYKDFKGIIHTPSYKLAEDVYMGLSKENRARILFPKKAKDIQDALNRHKDSDRPTVLMSPAMAEGLDLSENLSRWQLILKMPYPSLADKVVQARMKKFPQWYAFTTALKLIQSYGRSVRSETDQAVTFILDEAFDDVLYRNGKNLPKWFTDAIRS